MKKEEALNKKMSILGGIKFFASLSILFFHTLPPERHWTQLYLFVEFFFVVTGFFTFKHFQRDIYSIEKNTLEEKSEKALKYTMKKFTHFVPYVLIAVIIRYIVLFCSVWKYGIIQVIKTTASIPLDLLFLNSQNGHSDMPTWFLSAMVIVFPMFCLVCQTKNKKTLFLLSLSFIIVYYTNYFHGAVYYKESLLRAFAGMLTGIIVYCLSEILHTFRMKRNQKILLQITEVILFVCAFLSMYPSKMSVDISLYCIITMVFFVLYLIVFFSGQTISSKISNPILDHLEQISMVLYIVHIPLMRMLDLLPFHFENTIYRRFILIASSVVGSIGIYFLFEFVCWCRKTKSEN